MDMLSIFADELDKLAVFGQMTRQTYRPAGDPKEARSMIAKSLVGLRQKWGPAAGRIGLADVRAGLEKQPFTKAQKAKEIAKGQYGGLKEWTSWPEVEGPSNPLIERGISTPEWKTLSHSRQGKVIDEMETQAPKIRQRRWDEASKARFDEKMAKMDEESAATLKRLGIKPKE